MGRIETADGELAVFVPLTAPGDRAEVLITRVEKRYLEARLVNLLESGPGRISPRCVYFGTCGGCTWQHLPYSRQWQVKRDGVLHALSRTEVSLPSAPPDEFPAPHEYSYRNRVQMRGEGDVLGFFARGSRELINIERCEISREPINSRITGVRAEGRGKPPYKVEIEVLLDGEVVETWNARHAARGFRQVNDEQNDALKAWVGNQLAEEAHLFDLYGGNGNLSWDLRDRMKWIDVVDLGSPDLRDQERLPGQPEHYRFYPTDVSTWLKRRVRDKERGYFRFSGPFHAILDPPREGLANQGNLIAEALATLGVDRLILVGCDPDSWARDLARLQKHGWALERFAIFDLFPQTPHVESAGLLTRRV